MTVVLWILAAVLIALWSLAGWGLHRLLTMDSAWLTELPERLQTWVATWPWADQLDRVWPGWIDGLRLGAELTRSLLGWLGEGALWIVWGLWALGTVAMLAGTALLAWLIGYAKRNALPPSVVERRAARAG